MAAGDEIIFQFHSGVVESLVAEFGALDSRANNAVASRAKQRGSFIQVQRDVRADMPEWTAVDNLRFGGATEIRIDSGSYDVINLSGGGICFQLREDVIRLLQEGDQVSFDFKISADTTYQVRKLIGTVTWSSGDMLGVQFSDMPDDQSKESSLAHMRRAARENLLGVEASEAITDDQLSAFVDGESEALALEESITLPIRDFSALTLKQRLHVLSKPIEAGDIEFHFQPIVSDSDGYQRFEVLTRFHFAPGIFESKKAEPSVDQIFRDLDFDSNRLAWSVLSRAFEKSFAEARRYMDESGEQVRLYFNAAEPLLRSTSLVGVLEQSLSRHGLGFQNLGIEVTEVRIDALGTNQQSLETIAQLQSRGAAISIDDVGAEIDRGSNLYMSQLSCICAMASKGIALDEVKFDSALCKSFIAKDPMAIQVVRSIMAVLNSIAMYLNVHVDVVCEQVEGADVKTFMNLSTSLVHVSGFQAHEHGMPNAVMQAGKNPLDFEQEQMDTPWFAGDSTGKSFDPNGGGADIGMMAGHYPDEVLLPSWQVEDPNQKMVLVN